MNYKKLYICNIIYNIICTWILRIGVACVDNRKPVISLVLLTHLICKIIRGVTSTWLLQCQVGNGDKTDMFRGVTSTWLLQCQVGNGDKTDMSYRLVTLRGNVYMCLFISKSFSGSDIVYFGEIKRWRLYVLTFSEMEFP